MMNFEPIFNNPDTNYVEILLLPPSLSNESPSENLECYTTEFTRDEFYTILSKMKKDDCVKYFQKQCKEYVHEDIIFEHGQNDEIRVHQKKPVDFCVYNRLAMCAYNKKKLSILSFPSSHHVNLVHYITKFIFRINNRIYINFESKMNKNKTTYSIYINYNHDQNVDKEVYSRLLNTTIKSILL